MDQKLQNWREKQMHLPPFMRDFHNCKELFKGIEQFLVFDDDNPAKTVSWVQAHCYTVDAFLWFMARHGYTLQRSRANQSFDDLGSLLKELKEERQQTLEAIFEPSKTAPISTENDK